MTHKCRVSPFRDPRIEACLPAPRGLSQATTSFVASRCQGIHHTLLVASSLRPLTGVIQTPALSQNHAPGTINPGDPSRHLSPYTRGDIHWSDASRASTSKRLHSVLLYKKFSNTQDIYPLVKEQTSVVSSGRSRRTLPPLRAGHHGVACWRDMVPGS